MKLFLKSAILSLCWHQQKCREKSCEEHSLTKHNLRQQFSNHLTNCIKTAKGLCTSDFFCYPSPPCKIPHHSLGSFNCLYVNIMHSTAFICWYLPEKVCSSVFTAGFVQVFSHWVRVNLFRYNIHTKHRLNTSESHSTFNSDFEQFLFIPSFFLSIRAIVVILS